MDKYKTIIIPSEHDIREDLHSIRKITTKAGSIRFIYQKQNDY
jgi:hypothetical protein